MKEHVEILSERIEGRLAELSDGRQVWLGNVPSGTGVLCSFKNRDGDFSQLALSHEAMEALISLYYARKSVVQVNEWRLIPDDSADGAEAVVRHDPLTTAIDGSGDANG